MDLRSRVPRRQSSPRKSRLKKWRTSPWQGSTDDAAGIQTGHADKLPARRTTRAATPAGARPSEVAEPEDVRKWRKEKGMDTKHHVAAVDAGQLGIEGGDDDGASTWSTETVANGRTGKKEEINGYGRTGKKKAVGGDVSQGKGDAGGAAVELGGRLNAGEEKEKGKGKKGAAAVPATVKGPPLPFVVQNIAAGCKGRLSWSNEEIMIWLGEYAQQFLVGWKTGCYDDEAPRANIINELSTQGRKLSATSKARTHYKTPYSAVLSDDAKSHIAHTAIKIHHISFKNTDWAAAFSLGDDGGYGIAVDLVLDVFCDLRERGNCSYFLAFLGGKPQAGVMCHAPIPWNGKIEVPRKDAVVTRSKVKAAKEGTKSKQPAVKRDGEDMELDTETPANIEMPAQVSETVSKKEVNPTPGKIETQHRNLRRRDTKKLKHLKEVGVLPPDADFTVLNKWREANKEGGAGPDLVKESNKMSEGFDEKGVRSGVVPASQDIAHDEIGKSPLAPFPAALVLRPAKRRREKRPEDDGRAEYVLEKKTRFDLP